MKIPSCQKHTLGKHGLVLWLPGQGRPMNNEGRRQSCEQAQLCARGKKTPAGMKGRRPGRGQIRNRHFIS
jgi:hypothetical protein